MKESQIQSAILDYLAARRVMAFRMNTGAARMGERFIRFGVPGMADILAFPKIRKPDLTNWGKLNCASHAIPIALWIECKASKGIQSALQRSFQAQVEGEGHTYIIARSIEDVEKAL